MKKKRFFVTSCIALAVTFLDYLNNIDKGREKNLLANILVGFISAYLFYLFYYKNKKILIKNKLNLILILKIFTLFSLLYVLTFKGVELWIHLGASVLTTMAFTFKCVVHEKRYGEL